MTRCASAHDAAQSLYGLRADLCLCDAVGDGVEVAMSGHAHLLKCSGSFIMMAGSTSGRHAHTDGLSGSFDAFGILLIHTSNDSLYALQKFAHFRENLISLGRG